MHDQYAAETEEHEVSNPHAPAQVHGLLAVIPPAGVKALFQNVAGHVLEHPAEDEADGEGGEIARFDRGEGVRSHSTQHCPEAVDGQPRPGEKAAVNKAAELKVFERHLHAPPGDGEDKKDEDEIDDIFRVVHAFFLVLIIICTAGADAPGGPAEESLKHAFAPGEYITLYVFAKGCSTCLGLYRAGCQGCQPLRCPVSFSQPVYSQWQLK